MSGRARCAMRVGAGLALHVALALGALEAVPAPLRIALSFAVLVLVPGAAFVSLGAVPPGGPWLSPGWALGFGIAWNGVLVMITRALGVPFTVLAGLSAATSAILWAAVLLRPVREVAPPAPRLGGAALAAVLAAALFAGYFTGRLGSPMSFDTDTPDHVGTVRRMLEKGDAFPNDAFYRDAGPTGADPRKGLWHPEVALIARLATADPVDAWRWLSAFVVPLLVLNVAALGWVIGGPAGAAVAAATVLLTYGRGLAFTPIRSAVFASRLVDHLATATAAAVLADLGARRRGSRLAAAGLGFAAVAVHVFAAIQFAVVFSALAVAILLRDRRIGGDLKRLAGTMAALAALSLPYLIWRLHHADAPTNIIHTQPQGLLWITGPWRVVSIGVLWEWVGSAWVLFPLAWLWLWKRGRDSAGALYVLGSSLAVFLLIFNPLAVAVLEPRVGYLLMRMTGLLSLPALLALIVPALARTVAGAAPAGRRLAAALGLALVAATVAPALSDAARAVLDPESLVRAERLDSPTRWSDALSWMERELPAGRVVLSDPVTSYSIPMMTRHYVATLVDQHSSPNDSLALTRLLDARDALDPYGSWDRTREVVRRYGVDVIALNDRFASIPRLDYWTPYPGWYAAARARLDRHPAAFERLFDTGDFVVYRLREAALDTLRGPAPARPYVAPWSRERFAIGLRFEAGLPVVLGCALSRGVAAPSESLSGVIEWRAVEPAPPGSYNVSVRFDRALPGGFKPPAAIGKPLRKLLERARGERYRFREDHLPAGGGYGVDRWRPDEVVRDSFRMAVPPDVADGLYRVQVRMLHQPHYANLRLSDYFSDDDSFSGVAVGWLEVRRPGAPPAGPQDGAAGGH